MISKEKIHIQLYKETPQQQHHHHHRQWLAITCDTFNKEINNK
jgi:hypothetical protein